MDLEQPLFFRPNRVWRCYRGGKLLDEFMGKRNGEDSQFPENWLGSTTVACNGEHQSDPEEGLSRLADGNLFAEALKANARSILGRQGTELGVLCKFLDAAIRLPIQCHPDKALAKRYFESPYGKTESWFILDTREINGEKPYIMMGFKPGVTRERFTAAVAAQDSAGMLEMMHRIEVKAGDAYFVPGRLPHAIGAGVFMLEVQEPSDWVIQPERKIGKVELSSFDMWNKLTPEQGLACFNYCGETLDEVIARCRIPPRKDGSFVSLVDEKLTDCFKVSRLNLEALHSLDYRRAAPWELWIVTEGKGALRCGRGSFGLERGTVFLVPNILEGFTFTAEEPLELYRVFR